MPLQIQEDSTFKNTFGSREFNSVSEVEMAGNKLTQNLR